jgi:hypothetical protein
MNTTQTSRPISIIAARVNRGDILDIEGDGDFRQVDDICLRAGRVLVEFVDGEVCALNPLRYVEVMA